MVVIKFYLHGLIMYLPKLDLQSIHDCNIITYYYCGLVFRQCFFKIIYFNFNLYYFL